MMQSANVFFIVPDEGDAHVLLAQEGTSWTLPHVSLAGSSSWQSTSPVNKAANDTLGIRATTRRCVSPDMDPGSPVREMVYVVENHSATWTVPATARWVGMTDLASLSLATPGMVRVLGEWFAWVNAEDKSLRVPWYEAGWMKQAGAWMVQQLAMLDSKPTGPVEQICSWQRSCVMRLPTTHGTVYFKAVPAVLGSEVAISVLLDHEYPGMVASDSSR